MVGILASEPHCRVDGTGTVPERDRNGTGGDWGWWWWGMWGCVCERKIFAIGRRCWEVAGGCGKMDFEIVKEPAQSAVLFLVFFSC
ncbi:hypothetical protein ES703_53528 [subsurface metagenome]